MLASLLPVVVFVFWQPEKCHFISQCVLYAQEASVGFRVAARPFSHLGGMRSPAAATWPPQLDAVFTEPSRTHVHGWVLPVSRQGWGHRITNGGGSHQRSGGDAERARWCPRRRAVQQTERQVTCPLLSGSSAFMFAFNGLNIIFQLSPKG